MALMISFATSLCLSAASKSGASSSSEWYLKKVSLGETVLREDVCEDIEYLPPLARRNHKT
jgi:hypothetical protein